MTADETVLSDIREVDVLRIQRVIYHKKSVRTRGTEYVLHLNEEALGLDDLAAGIKDRTRNIVKATGRT